MNQYSLIVLYLSTLILLSVVTRLQSSNESDYQSMLGTNADVQAQYEDQRQTVPRVKSRKRKTKLRNRQSLRRTTAQPTVSPNEASDSEITGMPSIDASKDGEEVKPTKEPQAITKDKSTKQPESITKPTKTPEVSGNTKPTTEPEVVEKTKPTKPPGGSKKTKPTKGPEDRKTKPTGGTNAASTKPTKATEIERTKPTKATEIERTKPTKATEIERTKPTKAADVEEKTKPKKGASRRKAKQTVDKKKFDRTRPTKATKGDKVKPSKAPAADEKTEPTKATRVAKKKNPTQTPKKTRPTVSAGSTKGGSTTKNGATTKSPGTGQTTKAASGATKAPVKVDKACAARWPWKGRILSMTETGIRFCNERGKVEDFRMKIKTEDCANVIPGKIESACPERGKLYFHNHVIKRNECAISICVEGLPKEITKKNCKTNEPFKYL